MTARGFDTDWRESIGYLLRDATRLMLRVMAARVAANGITMTQYFLLRQLWENDGQLQRDLARQLDVPEPALASLLDALEAVGLVIRKRSTIDRRRTHVHVTPAGKALRGPLIHEGRALLEGMLESCSQRSIDDLRRTLKKIKANLEEIAAAS